MPPPSMLLTQHNFCTLLALLILVDFYSLLPLPTLINFCSLLALAALPNFCSMLPRAALANFCSLLPLATLVDFLLSVNVDHNAITGLLSQNGYAGRPAALPQCHSDALLKWVLYVSG